VAFCTYSSSINDSGYTMVENSFINEFLPQAPAEYVKVYLYGLSLCSNPNQDYNSADSAAAFLNMSEDEIIEAFEYFQSFGIVQILSTKPLEIKFLSVKQHSGSSKIRVKGKYAEFNKQVQNIITGRMIQPIEYNEYYNLIESLHFEPDALVMIIKYCTTIKNDKVSYPYILAVAKSFAEDNAKNTAAVEKKFLEQEKNSAEIKQIMDALGVKRAPDIDERNCYQKWISNFGFSHGVVLQVAKDVKTGGIHKLDSILTKYYEQKLFTIKEITEYSANREKMFDTAKNISRNLGLYYQNLENVVETYISDWFNKGYTEETLNQISNYCFKHSYRSLESMSDVVNKFYKLGLVNSDSINQYMQDIVYTDQKIKEIIDTCGLLRSVNSSDREFYKTWTTNWGFAHEIILLVAQKAVGKNGPISYINKILSTLFYQNKKSKQEVTDYLSTYNSSTENQSYEHHEYTKDELNALFDSLDDIEV